MARPTVAFCRSCILHAPDCPRRASMVITVKDMRGTVLSEYPVCTPCAGQPVRISHAGQVEAMGETPADPAGELADAELADAETARRVSEILDRGVRPAVVDARRCR